MSCPVSDGFGSTMVRFRVIEKKMLNPFFSISVLVLLQHFIYKKLKNYKKKIRNFRLTTPNHSPPVQFRTSMWGNSVNGLLYWEKITWILFKTSLFMKLWNVMRICKLFFLLFGGGELFL